MSYTSSSLGIATLEQRRRSVETADPGVVSLARQRYNEAQAAFDARNYESAIRLFTEAWGLVPHPTVLVAIGLTLLRLGRFQDAIYRLQRYLREEPNGPERDRARRFMAEAQAAMEQQARQSASAPRPPAPPPEVPAEVLEQKRAEIRTPEAVERVQREATPQSVSHPYEARTATYIIWAATGVGVLGLGLVGYHYWKRSKAPAAPVKRNRRRRQARRTSRRMRRNAIDEATKKRAKQIGMMRLPTGEAKKRLKAEIRSTFPPPTAAEIKKWNRDRGTDIMDVIDAYAERTGMPTYAARNILQLGWQLSSGQLKANARRMSRRTSKRRSSRRHR